MSEQLGQTLVRKKMKDKNIETVQLQIF